MRVDVYLPLLFTCLFGLTAPRLARRLPPAIASWLLSLGGLICAAGSGASLAFLAWTLVGQRPDVAADGHWSIHVLRAHDLVPTPVAVAALVALGLALTAAGVALVGRVRALHRAYRFAATLGTHGGQLVVVDDDRLPACAIPGRPGRIVIPAGLLRGLAVTERRALLAHEHAHLRHRHHLHRAAGTLAAAANPLLHRLPAALALSTERWADEDAATQAPRDVVAHALTRAAVLTRPTGLGVALGAAASHVAARVSALTAPPPRPVRWRIVLLTALIAATVLATLEAARETEGLFELAMHGYRLAHG